MKRFLCEREADEQSANGRGELRRTLHLRDLRRARNRQHDHVRTLRAYVPERRDRDDPVAPAPDQSERGPEPLEVGPKIGSGHGGHRGGGLEVEPSAAGLDSPNPGRSGAIT
jgi:hypothetical protein